MDMMIRIQLENPDDIRAGYQFIEKHAPRSMRGNKQNEWVRLQLCDVDSPLIKWLKSDIKEALANLRQTEGHAETLDDFPITFIHLSHPVQQVLLEIARSFLKKGVLLLGKAGAGKSPLQIVLNLLMSRINQWLDSRSVVLHRQPEGCGSAAVTGVKTRTTINQ